MNESVWIVSPKLVECLENHRDFENAMERELSLNKKILDLILRNSKIFKENRGGH